MQQKFLEQAISLALEGMNQYGEQGRPFGAVIVQGEKVIGRGMNLAYVRSDPTAHAEIEAIRDAAQHLQSPSLEGCVLYSSCEPCPMCLAAAYWAKIEKVYFATSGKEAAAYGFDQETLYEKIAQQPPLPDIPQAQYLQNKGLQVFEKWKEINEET